MKKSNGTTSLSRRDFVKKSSLLGMGIGSGIGLGLGSKAKAAPAFLKSLDDLSINRIIIQDAMGRRATPIAPNAYIGSRGYSCREPMIRIQTDQGLEGVTRVFNAENRKETLQQLIGMNPFDLFEWKDGIAVRPAEAHRELVESLRGFDIAVFDLLGKATRKPVADLLGKRIRDYTQVYDSCLYQEDLLSDEELKGVAYLEGRSIPRNREDLVAYKADWLINKFYKEEGIRIFKIKTGRAKWMNSREEALQRDIDVFKSIRKAVGPFYTLFVDVNNGYDDNYTETKRFVEQTMDQNMFGFEEAFQESMVDEHKEVMEHIYDLGLSTRNIDGETGGIDYEYIQQTIDSPYGEKALFDIDNPSFSHYYGFVGIRDICSRNKKHGVLVGPHNFGSKIGFYASIHMGMSVENWAYVETDDSDFPALRAPGISVKNGKAWLTGIPGLGVEVDPGKLEKPKLIID